MAASADALLKVLMLGYHPTSFHEYRFSQLLFYRKVVFEPIKNTKRLKSGVDRSSFPVKFGKVLREAIL